MQYVLYMAVGMYVRPPLTSIISIEAQRRYGTQSYLAIKKVYTSDRYKSNMCHFDGVTSFSDDDTKMEIFRTF